MLKSEYLEKKQRWFQAKYPLTWEAEWMAWVESNPDVPGEEDTPPEMPEGHDGTPEEVEALKAELKAKDKGPKVGVAKPYKDLNVRQERMEAAKKEKFSVEVTHKPVPAKAGKKTPKKRTVSSR